jgi:hypothetical protein
MNVQVVAVIYIVTFSAIHFKLLTTRQAISFRQALSDSPGSAVAFSIGVLVVWPLLALWGYHLRVSVELEERLQSGADGRGLTGVANVPQLDHDRASKCSSGILHDFQLSRFV